MSATCADEECAVLAACVYGGWVVGETVAWPASSPDIEELIKSVAAVTFEGERSNASAS